MLAARDTCRRLRSAAQDGEKATELLTSPSTNAKVMVMFTDGKTTAGPNPSPIAAAARAAGAVIYAIGLSGSDGVDVSALDDREQYSGKSWRKDLKLWGKNGTFMSEEIAAGLRPRP